MRRPVIPFNNVEAVGLIEKSVHAKRKVKQLLTDEKEIAATLAKVSDQHEKEIHLGLRLLTYDETHTNEKTEIIRAVEILAAAAKIDVLLNNPSRLGQILSNHGLRLTVVQKERIPNKTLSAADKKNLTTVVGKSKVNSIQDLFEAVFVNSIDRRLDICGVMKTRKEVRKRCLEMEMDPKEYTRLHQMAELTMAGNEKGNARKFARVDVLRGRIDSSVEKLKDGMKILEKKRTAKASTL